MARDVLGALDLAALTDVGLRRQRNEDACMMLVPPPGISQAAHGALFIVADGMGGLGGGDVASKVAIDEFVRQYYGSANKEKDLIARLIHALEAANIFVREQAARMGLTRIGTTAAGMLLRPNGEAVIFNVGDCRVYRVRNGSIERISRDQSVMERQIESGLVSEEAARASRNSMVTAFLGQPLPIKPFFLRVTVQPNDVYLICSDGLWGLAEPGELLKVIQGSSAKAAVQKFIRLALKRGGSDNITAIMVRFGRPPGGIRRLFMPLVGLFLVILAVVGVLLVVNGLNNPESRMIFLGGPTATATATPSMTESPPTLEATATAAVTNTEPALIQVRPSATPLPATPTATFTISSTPTRTMTPSATPSATLTRTAAPSATATLWLTATATLTPSPTPSLTHTASATPTASPTRTPTATPTPSRTFTPESTAALPPLLGATSSLTPSRTPTMTRTSSATPTATSTGRARFEVTPPPTSLGIGGK